MKKSLLTVFSAVFMFIAAILAVSCGGGGGGAIAATGGNNKGKHFGSGTESGSKIQLTSNQLFSGETASMMATTSYDFIRLKVSVNGIETIHQIQKGQNIELNIGTTIGDKLQMYAEICDASGTVLRTATSDPITVGLGTNNVVMYIIYKAKLHHADGTTTEYSFTSLGSTLPADSATYPIDGYVFNAWASGFSSGSYDGTNASGVFTNSIAPGTRNDVELYAHWKLAPLEDGGVPVPGKHFANYYADPTGTPNKVEFAEGVGIASLDTPTPPAGFGDGIFGGWYTGFSAGTGVSGSQITSISPTETSDVNLYAKWTFPVNYYADPAGATSISDTYQYGAGSSLAGTPNLPAGYATGAEFKGWYPKNNYSPSTGAGGVKATSISATQTGKVEYVARWEYKVTLFNNPLNLNEKTEYSYVKETGYRLPAPTRPTVDASTGKNWGSATFDKWYEYAVSSSYMNPWQAGVGIAPNVSGNTSGTVVLQNVGGNKSYYAWWKSKACIWRNVTVSGDSNDSYYVGVGFTSTDNTWFFDSSVNSSITAAVKTEYACTTDAEANALIKFLGYYNGFAKTAGSATLADYKAANFTNAITAVPATVAGDYNVYTGFSIGYTVDTYPNITTFKVKTAAQLEQLAELANVNNKDFSGKTIEINADISATYTSGGLRNFAGTLNGNNHTITLSNGYALVTGTLTGTVTNVVTAGTVSKKYGTYGAAIAEESNGGTVTCCINKANISAKGAAIVGKFTGSGNTISKCGNEGAVSQATGGLLGWCDEASSSTVTNCYNIGTITKASNSYPGGIVGYNKNVSVTNCYDMSTGSTFSNDIQGYGSSSNVVNCYSTGQKGSGSSNGTKVTNFANESSFPSFDFTNIWEIKNGRPVLRGVGN